LAAHHLQMKENAKQFLSAYWSKLDSLLGQGHTVASPFTPEEAQDPIWANAKLAYPIKGNIITFFMKVERNSSLAELHNMQPVINTEPEASNGKLYLGFLHIYNHFFLYIFYFLFFIFYFLFFIFYFLFFAFCRTI
jgi:hypothetical protein